MLQRINKLTWRLRGDDRGLTTVEYVIILALIAVAGLQIWGTFGDKVGEWVTDQQGKIDAKM